VTVQTQNAAAEILPKLNINAIMQESRKVNSSYANTPTSVSPRMSHHSVKEKRSALFASVPSQDNQSYDEVAEYLSKADMIINMINNQK